MQSKQSVLNNISLNWRLCGPILISTAVTALLILVSWIGLDKIHRDIDLINEDRYLKVKAVTQIKDDLNLKARSVRNLIVFDDPSIRELEFKQIVEARERIDHALQRLAPLLESNKEKQLFEQVMVQRRPFSAALDRFLSIARQSGSQDMRSSLQDTLRPRQLEYMASLDQLVSYEEELMEMAGVETEHHIRDVTSQMVGLGLIGALSACAFGIWIAKRLSHQLSQVISVASAVADGDLTQDITVHGRDEIGQMMQALARMQSQLKETVNTVRLASDSIATGASEIATGNHDLSYRTEQQAASLQQTAASMEEMSATVKANADTAGVANGLAQSAGQAAQDGGEVMDQMISTMSEIAESSRRISEITNVIDGIAFQTNILALNAAVESARAGEHGRGFAVVANEVRTLAQRSAQAAKEIKSLIAASGERVQRGSDLVEQAGTAMDDIVSRVRRVSDLIQEINVATQQQSQGISQVGAAVSHLDQSTQQNAALVEEAAAAAGSLSHQADALVNVITRFKLS